jgi:predicted nucleotidyltransferase component of viral defense system
MDKEEIAAEKIRAILTRLSARDLYDLHFLLYQKTSLRKELVENKLAYYDLTFNQEAFEKKVGRLRRIWKKEIAALTPSMLDYEIAAQMVVEKTKEQLG